MSFRLIHTRRIADEAIHQLPNGKTRRVPIYWAVWRDDGKTYPAIGAKQRAKAARKAGA